MPQIEKSLHTTLPESNYDKSLDQELRDYVTNLANLLNKGLRFSDNFDMNILTVSDSGTANTEFTVAHTLKRVPIGYLPIKQSIAGSIYLGSSSWTATNIYLKCSTGNNALTLLVF